MDERLKTNLAKWDAVVPVHARSDAHVPRARECIETLRDIRHRRGIPEHAQVQHSDFFLEIDCHTLVGA